MENILLTHDPHVCVITESWLHEAIGDSEIVPPNYQLFRCDRGHRGGGVAVIIKYGIDVTIAERFPVRESLLLKLSFADMSFFLCAVYRCPNADDSFMSGLYDELLRLRSKNLILTGDFNLPAINWDDINYGTSSSADTLLDIMFSLGLEQMVGHPTRGSSILDLLFTTELFTEATITVETGISDHRLISFVWDRHARCKSVKTPVESVVRDFNRADDVAVIDYLETHLPTSVSDVDRAWQRFRGIVDFCTKNFVPLRRIRRRSHNPWINREIIQIKRKIKRLRKKHKTSTQHFSDLKEKLLESVSKARHQFFNDTLPEFIRTDPDKFWRYIKQTKEGVSEIQVDEVTITDPALIADHFNKYFQSVFSEPQYYELRDPMPIITDDVLITREGVLQMLLKVNPKKSSGPDGIGNSFLRRYAEQITDFLTALFNVSFKYGQIPDDWRKARVVPIFKKGNRYSLTNYRPVSITSSCCKMLEHVVANYINTFLSENNILSPNQHGFRKNMSTVTQLVSTVHEFARVLDISGQTDVFFLDFSKAFDKVPHGKLLFKLENIGLPSGIVKWIHMYLNNRTQFVEVRGCFSSSLNVSSGVPQGSVLGPLLFLIFINDLVDVVHKDISVRLFADDCVVFKEICCVNDHILLQQSLTSIDEWCQNWGMELNSDKTVLLRITRKRTPSLYTYFLRNNPLKDVEKYKYLGVTLTKSLTWSDHITSICTAALRKLWFLKRKLKSSTKETRLLAYNTCIRSKLEYASVVWDPQCKKDIALIEKVQRKAVRFIFSKYKRYDSPTQLMQLNDIQTLEIRRKINRLTFLHKILSGKVTTSLPNCVKPLSSRKTRHKHKYSLAPVFARTTAFKNSFFPRTIADWNSLPISAFQSEDIENSLKLFLFSSE